MPRTVKVTIEASVAGAIANVKAFRGAVADMGGELDRAAVKHPESLNRISAATTKLGLAAAVGFGLVVKTAMDFDKQMSAVVAVSDDGVKSFGALRDAALAAGRDTAFTATQAAQAEEELAKAGVSTKDVLGGGLRGALSLAAAGQLDLGQAATISAQAMNEFALSGKDVPRIADDLASAANASAADVAGLGEALGQVGGVAHQVGLTLEDTVGTLADFTQQGMQGEEAGTTLKQMLIKLTAPTKQAGDLMKQLGINVYDSQGQFIGITAVAQNLHDTLGGLTQAQRNAALGTIFGARAIRGATVLYQQGAAGLQDWIDKSSQTGAAAQVAATKLDNLSGDLHKLLGSLQKVAIDGAGGTTSALRGMVQGAEAAVNAFGDLPKPISETGTALLGISATGLLATAGLLKVKTTVTQAMEALSNMGPVGDKVAGALGKIGKVGGVLGVASVAAFALWEGFKALSGWLDKSSQPVHRDIDQLTNDLKSFAETGRATGEMAKAFGAQLGQLGKDMKAITTSHLSMAQLGAQLNAAANGPAAVYQAHAANAEAAKKAASDIAALDTALAQLATNGGATQAKIAFDRITQSLLAQGVPMSQITSMFGQYEAAAANVATAAGPLAQGFADAGIASGVLAKGMQDAINHGQTLLDVFKELNGAALDMLSADIAVKQDLADLADKWTKNKSAIDDNTQAGRDNLKMVAQTIQDAAQAAQAKYAETGSVQDAVAAYNGYIDGLRRTLTQLGLTTDQVNSLIGTYARMPPAVATAVQAPGASQALTVANQLRDTLNALHSRSINIDVSLTGSGRALVNNQGTYLIAGTGQRYQRWGGVTQYAATGLLRQADVYRAGARPMYGFAEPATRGEAFIPRSGDLTRSRGIADYVVSHWLGGRVAWGGGAGAGGGGNLTITLAGGDAVTRQVMGALRAEISGTYGGNVQVALGKN